MLSNVLKAVFIIGVVAFFAISSTGSYFSDTVVVSGNSFTAGTWDTDQNIVINEVYYDGNKEWIELYNAGSETVDIKGWTICNSSGECGSLNPAQKTEVEAGGFVAVAHDAGDLNSWFIPATAEKIYYAGARIEFDDTGDSVILKNTDDSVVDQMSYFDNLVGAGHSLKRESGGTFIEDSSPTPGSLNAE